MESNLEALSSEFQESIIVEQFITLILQFREVQLRRLNRFSLADSASSSVHELRKVKVDMLCSQALCFLCNLQTAGGAADL
jgi:hypothetical protein